MQHITHMLSPGNTVYFIRKDYFVSNIIYYFIILVFRRIHPPIAHLQQQILTIELLVLVSKNLSLSDRSNLATQNRTGLVLAI